MKIAETYLNIILKGPMKIMLMFLQETSTLSNEFPELNESAGFNVNEHIRGVRLSLRKDLIISLKRKVFD